MNWHKKIPLCPPGANNLTAAWSLPPCAEDRLEVAPVGWSICVPAAWWQRGTLGTLGELFNCWCNSNASYRKKLRKRWEKLNLRLEFGQTSYLFITQWSSQIRCPQFSWCWIIGALLCDINSAVVDLVLFLGRTRSYCLVTRLQWWDFSMEWSCWGASSDGYLVWLFLSYW
jgi:hypothetical protein